MCIAISKPEGVTGPSEEILKRCWDKNPDGAGFCFAERGIVKGYKGFMTFEHFLDAWNILVPIHAAALIHFRIATHGGVKPSGTHPFPVTAAERALKATVWSSSMGVAHNGIMMEYGTEHGLSDTQEFIRDILSARLVRENMFTDKALQYFMGNASYSKWAFLRGDGKAITFGHWIKSGGISYSNEGFQPPAIMYYKGKKIEKKHWLPREVPFFDDVNVPFVDEDTIPDNCPYITGEDWIETCPNCPHFKNGICEAFGIEIPYSFV